LKTSDGATTSTVANFPSCFIPGFKQLNKTHVLVLKHCEYCIKLLSRKDNSLKTVAGSCGRHGIIDGGLGVGRFKYPYSIEVDFRYPNTFLVTDSQALRSININTGKVSTVTDVGFTNVRAMAWVGDTLLVTNNHYISEVTWCNEVCITNFPVAGSSTSGYTDGKFNDSRFHTPAHFVYLAENLLLLTDPGNRVLRLLDTEAKTVGPVCFDIATTNCEKSSKFTKLPQSVVKVGNDLYVGLDDCIYKLSGL